MADLERTDSASPRKRNPSDFDFGRLLGEGSYSTVYFCKEKISGKEFAAKVLDKRHILKEKKVKYVNVEKDVLNKTNHPYIIRLYYTFQDAHSLYFVLELARNGDLLSHLKAHGRFQEPVVRFYAHQIVEALVHLHSLDIIHRDLKPENILLDSDFNIKISDFGSAKLLQEQEENRRNSFVGTAEYCSPELLNDRAASKASDIWSLGCILYQLLVGKCPFKGSNEYQTFQQIIGYRYVFPQEFPPLGKELIQKILVESSSRPSLQDIAQHPFLQGEKYSQPTPVLEPLHILYPNESSISSLSSYDWDPQLVALLNPCEQPTMFGIVNSKSLVFSKSKGLLLTNERLILYHPKSFELESVLIPIGVESLGDHKFEIKTAEKSYIFEDKQNLDWVSAIQLFLQTCVSQ